MTVLNIPARKYTQSIKKDAQELTDIMSDYNINLRSVIAARLKLENMDDCKNLDKLADHMFNYRDNYVQETLRDILLSDRDDSGVEMQQFTVRDRLNEEITRPSLVQYDYIKDNIKLARGYNFILLQSDSGKLELNGSSPVNPTIFVSFSTLQMPYALVQIANGLMRITSKNYSYILDYHGTKWSTPLHSYISRDSLIGHSEEEALHISLSPTQHDSKYVAGFLVERPKVHFIHIREDSYPTVDAPRKIVEYFRKLEKEQF